MEIKLAELEKIKLINSDDIFLIMQQILLREDKIDQDKEHFWVIGLTNVNRIQYIELVSIGSVNSTIVEPANVFRLAIQKNAVKIILIHNHPSYELKPSSEDKETTDRLIQVGAILNIDVIEHLIIGPKSYLSFCDTGLLEGLSQNSKFLPAYELEEVVRQEELIIREEAVTAAQEEGMERGEERGMSKVVINASKKGMSNREISELTALTEKKIEELLI
jgi:DNA repair protein RadC